MPFITGLYIHGAGMNGHGRKEEGGNGALKNVACPLSMISLHVKRRVLHVQFNPLMHDSEHFIARWMAKSGKEGSVLEAIWHKEPPTNSFPLPPQPPLIVGCQMPTLNKGWRDARRWRRGRGGEFHRQLDWVLHGFGWNLEKLAD